MATLQLPDGRQAQYWDTEVGETVVFFFARLPGHAARGVPGGFGGPRVRRALVAANRPGYGAAPLAGDPRGGGRKSGDGAGARPAVPPG